jgi:hypothetical protein
VSQKKRSRTWHGHYIDRVRATHPRAIVPDGPDPLAASLAADNVTAEEYRAKLEEVRQGPLVANLMTWYFEQAVQGRAEHAFLALVIRHQLVDAGLERRAQRPFEPEDSDFAEVMALSEEHLALTYVISTHRQDHAKRLADLDDAEPRIQAAEQAHLRATLRDERRGFAELLGRYLEGFLDHAAAEADVDEFRAALRKRAKAKGADSPEDADVFADAFEEEVLRAVGRGEAGIIRALIQLPAQIADADRVADLALAAAHHAVTLVDVADEESGQPCDAWDQFEAGPVLLEAERDDPEHDQAVLLAEALPPSRSRDDVLAVLAGKIPADIARRTGRTDSAVSQSLKLGERQIRALLARQEPP